MSEEKHIEVKKIMAIVLLTRPSNCKTLVNILQKKRRNNITDLTLNVPPGHLLIFVL